MIETLNPVEKVKEPALPGSHLAVYRIIADSDEKYVTKNMIIAQLGKDSGYMRTLSHILHDLICVYKLPIGSSSRKAHKGFFIVRTEYDKYLALENLSSRVIAINNRYQATKNIETNMEELK